VIAGRWSLVAGAVFVGALTIGAPSSLRAQDSTPPSPALIETHARVQGGPPDRLTARPPVRLTFTGDINLGTSFLPNGVPPDTQASAFARVDSLLRGDLVIGNFEGVLSDTLPAAKCGGKSNCYEFRTPHRMVGRLVDAGFTHVNLANNHASDLGLPGRDETRAVLDSVGIKHYGMLGEIAFDSVAAMVCADGACAPDFGHWTRVAVIGFTTYDFAYNLLQIDSAKAVVDSMSHLADVVIVTFHGGTEGKKAVRVGTGMEHMGGERRGDLRKFTHAVIDAGADAVVGHGPHVLRGIEF